jgi:hypothetical protein
MADEVDDARFLEPRDAVTLAELIDASGFSEDELRELIEEGALLPMSVEATGVVFGSEAIVVARTAYRVRRDFALDDAHSVCVVLRYVERIERLEREVRALRARLPGA